MPEIQQAELLGVYASLVDYDAVVETVIAAARRRESAAVTFLAVHGTVEAARNPDLRRLVNGLSIVAPDGHGVRLGLNLVYRAGLSDRVYGPEAMLRICEAAAAAGVPIFLYGGRPESLEATSQNLRKRYPDLRIAGVEPHPFADEPAKGGQRRFRELTPEEDEALIDRIHRSGAGVVFLGLGCPRQERFAGEHLGRLQAVTACVGAAFDFHAGVKPMAPRWMQRWALEWLFRLLSEPRRLAGRYFTTNSIYLALLARQWLWGPRRRRSSPLTTSLAAGTVDVDTIGAGGDGDARVDADQLEGAATCES